MPLIKNDYSKTIIYKIVCKDLDVKDVYVGSSTNFVERKASHKKSCNNINGKSYNLKVYKTMRENGGFDNWSMIEIEKYVCLDSNESRTRERYWYEALNASLNSNCPSRAKKEYIELNKEVIAEKFKEYYENNKEVIKEYKKKYRYHNKEIISEKGKLTMICECGSKHRISDKSIHLQSIKHKDYLMAKTV